jgi:hypothetical protein
MNYRYDSPSTSVSASYDPHEVTERLIRWFEDTEAFDYDRIMRQDGVAALGMLADIAEVVIRFDVADNERNW